MDALPNFEIEKLTQEFTRHKIVQNSEIKSLISENDKLKLIISELQKKMAQTSQDLFSRESQIKLYNNKIADLKNFNEGIDFGPPDLGSWGKSMYRSPKCESPVLKRNFGTQGSPMMMTEGQSEDFGPYMSGGNGPMSGSGQKGLGLG